MKYKSEVSRVGMYGKNTIKPTASCNISSTSKLAYLPHPIYDFQYPISDLTKQSGKIRTCLKQDPSAYITTPLMRTNLTTVHQTHTLFQTKTAQKLWFVVSNSS